ncbi:FAD-dependent oxidoreductase [Paenibacillus sp. GCM10027626]|uniref:FAD-dependent oxidoreductase n=1 Tax=Paenibacillus sp. GCM10027626 TaxID=3273411 RepID=UPI0036299B5B
MDERTADCIVLGGGLGGCMATLSAAKMGLTVIMTEETDWLGGQLTSQGVPPDEHPWIESFGCTNTYRQFRIRVRQYYKENYPLTEEAQASDRLNPGNGWVSRLCHEPKVSLRVIEDMLSPYVNSGRIHVYYNYQVETADVQDDRVQAVTVKHISTGQQLSLRGLYFIDATECGDLLPLAGVEYVTGAEAKGTTGEPHAADEADPLDMQPITYVFAMDHIEGAHCTIDKPEQYDFWRNYIPEFSQHPLLSWYIPDVNRGHQLRQRPMMPDGSGELPLWTYRRIIDRSLFAHDLYESDITLVNWSQNDYLLGSIIDVPVEEQRRHLEGARQLSLSLIYWMQTEAPRPDGGTGYPGLRLRGDVLGTEDGLAKFPYIRESRRIKALYTITEHDVSRELRGSLGIKRYEDSVGVGSYYLDLHPTIRSNRQLYIPSLPYEIPLGSLLPVRMKNVLPACKNIGTTHISNGCYREHPTEWNIGEAVGLLVSYAIRHRITPHDVRAVKSHLQAYQELLRQQGIEVHWPEGMEGV